MPFLILFCFILRGFLFPYHEERSGTDHNDRGRSHRQQKRCSALRQNSTTEPPFSSVNTMRLPSRV